MMDACRMRTAPTPRRTGSVLLLTSLIASGTALALAGDTASHSVTQKGRSFAPGAISLRAGEGLAIVNDDGELVHHAYLENPDFSFDTGEQIPGSKTVVFFPKPGQFTILCGIHPKMKLAVSVK
ncbi:hypothetical protein [Methylorubrum extorquens]|uniref:hypothetical protein n=1 Tax=Methylorubrum extorquens TaxID=408 RepID=UPI0011BF21A1|nr:hypothetical protein [Methylorubrum extorquens]MCG5244978.1 hypothetical protein [Methylorubrum extorquens]